MMTNTKLLQEITELTQENNEALREQLRQQILEGTSELNRSVLQDFSDKYHKEFNELCEQSKQQNDDLLVKIDESGKQLTSELASKLGQMITESNQTMLSSILTEYNSKFESLRSEINNMQSENIYYIVKALSNSMKNLQRDNSIIMETLQLILTNLLIDGVGKK